MTESIQSKIQSKYDIRMNTLKKLDYFGHKWSPADGRFHNHFYVICVNCGTRMEYIPHVARVKNGCYKSDEWMIDGTDRIKKCTEVRMEEALG